MQQYYGPWIGSLTYVYAANNNDPITDAQFSSQAYESYPSGLVGYCAMGGPGNYFLQVYPGAYIAVSAPNYQTTYFYQPNYGPYDPNNPGTPVALTYIGGWPQNY